MLGRQRIAYVGFTGSTGGVGCDADDQQFQLYSLSGGPISTGNFQVGNNVAVTADTTIDVSNVPGALFGALSIGANKLTTTNASGGGATLALRRCDAHRHRRRFDDIRTQRQQPGSDGRRSPAAIGTSNTNTLVLDGTGVGNAVTGAITNVAGGGNAVAVVKSECQHLDVGRDKQLLGRYDDQRRHAGRWLLEFQRAGQPNGDALAVERCKSIQRESTISASEVGPAIRLTKREPLTLCPRPIVNDLLTLTDNAANQGRSVWFKTPLSVNGNFTASFVYKGHRQGIGNNNADGMTFTLQNVDRRADQQRSA